MSASESYLVMYNVGLKGYWWRSFAVILVGFFDEDMDDGGCYYSKVR